MPHRRSKSELVELVRRIMDADGTEREIDDMITALEENVPHPEVTDLIFYPEEGDPTPEEVVEEALAYKATPLGDGIRQS